MRKNQKLEYSWIMAVKDKDTDKFKGFITVPITRKQKQPCAYDIRQILHKIKMIGLPMGKMFKG